ncbi:uncharacterized protein V6R79_006928 [Siganus canaliculatus]
MAQPDTRDEDSLSSSSNSPFNLHSCFKNSALANLISQTQTMRTSEQPSTRPSAESNNIQEPGGLEDDSQNQLEDSRSAMDMSSALKSVALSCSLAFLKLPSSVPSLFSVPGPEDNSQTPIHDQDERTEGPADPAEEDLLDVSFQSKYINFSPLYQDYCLQAVKDELHKVSKNFASDMITSQYLQGLRSRLGSRGQYELTSSQLNPHEATPSPPPPDRIPKVTPCTLWQDLDEVKASGLLGTLTHREIRLQESMFELISSEASYLRSLRVAVTHFCAAKELKQTLSPMEHHILFSNIRRVMAASEKFLMDLEVRLGENVLLSQVGDVVLQHCPEFRKLYVPYVINMMYQEALINQLLEQNRDFLCMIKKLEGDPVCQRQSLKSFLVLPFQRITRIRLILESVLKLSEPGSDSILHLEKAIEAIHEIVTECDNGVRKMKQIEELVCLEMLFDFGKVKSVPLVVSGRSLVRHGPVRQLTLEAAYNSRVSFITVYLHLFNDLLIISSKKDGRFTVVDHVKFPTHVRLEHLKTEALGLPTESFLLHLSQSHTGQPTAMIFVGDSRSDKEAWMEALSSTR